MYQEVAHMAEDRGSVAKGRSQAKGAPVSGTKGTAIVTLNLSLTKKVATKVGRVKRWEERSKAKSLELTGRR